MRLQFHICVICSSLHSKFGVWFESCGQGKHGKAQVGDVDLQNEGLLSSGSMDTRKAIFKLLPISQVGNLANTSLSMVR